MWCAARAAPAAPATRARGATARASPSAVAEARCPRPAVRWTTAARVAHRHARGGVVSASAETRGVVRASRGARARGGARDASAEATPSPREGARDGDGGGGGGDDGGDDDDGGDESDDDGDESDDGRRAVWVFSLVSLAAPTFSGDAALSNRDDDRDDDAIARPTNDESSATKSEKTVSVIVPALNEAATIEYILTRVASLEPKAHEVIVCVGDSEDDTERIVNTKFPEFLVVRSKRGRSTQMNAGADVAGGDVFFFLHADTFVPSDVVDVVRATLKRDRRIVVGGFVSLIETSEKTFWGMSLHNVLKTYYAPLLLKPVSFFRGLRCLFGDQAMFVDAACFQSVGGFDESLPIMEDADLCVRMHESGWTRGSNFFAEGTEERFEGAARCAPLTCRGKWEVTDEASGDDVSLTEKTKKPRSRFRKTSVCEKAAGSDRGRIVLVNRAVTTSGRRIEGLGNFKATLTHFLIGVSWYCGADPDKMVALYRKFYPPANA
jgi:glycosyltransferase involved in cell wall biosynthesis